MAKGRGSSSANTKKDTSVVGQVKEFAVDSQRFLDKCTKPDKEGKIKDFVGFGLEFFYGFIFGISNS